MEAIGSALLSAAFEQLFENLASRMSLNFARESQVLDKFKKWERILKVIYAVLDDAEEKQMTNELVKNWASDLRDLAYDVEDILDEFATEAQRRKIMEEENRSSKVRKFLPACCSSGMTPITAIKFNSEMVSKMEGISARLQQIVEEQNVLGLREVVTGKRSSQGMRDRPPTTSLVNEATIYGREKDKEAILEMLKKENNPSISSVSGRRYSVIPIIGMGGLGKTTLAQLVYNDASLEFGIKAWVSIGEDFDVARITKTILGSDDNDLN